MLLQSSERVATCECRDFVRSRYGKLSSYPSANGASANNANFHTSDKLNKSEGDITKRAIVRMKHITPRYINGTSEGACQYDLPCF